MNPAGRGGADGRLPFLRPSLDDQPPPNAAPARATRSTAAFFAGSRAFGVDLGRLERALALQAFPAGPRRFEVTGGEETHFVDLSPDAACPCDCPDLAWRGGPREGPCKHVLRARLAEGDAETLLAVAALVAGMREYALGLQRALRPPAIRLTNALKSRVALAVRHPVSALTFGRAETGSDARVSVLLGTTGVLLGTLVRHPDGVEFVHAPSPAAAQHALAA
ncbi:MAG TPA: hypothetical protein VF006_13315 [Longimicrobium sp.]